METLFAFFTLFLLLSFSSTIDARKSPGEYSEDSMKDQPMPNSIQGLIRPNAEEKINYITSSQTIDDQSKEEKASFVKDFKPRPNPLFVWENVKQKEEKASFVKDFEPRPNPLFIWENVEPKEENASFVKDFEPRPNPLFVWENVEPKEEKQSFVKDFEPRPNPLFIWENVKQKEEKASFVKDFEPRPNPLFVWENVEPKEEKQSFVKDFEPRPNPLFVWENVKQKEEKVSFVKDFEPRPNPLFVWENVEPKEEKQSFVKDFKPRPNPLFVWENVKQKEEKASFVKDFEPRPNPLFVWENVKQKEEKTSFVKDFEPRPNPLFIWESVKQKEEKASFVKDFEPRPNPLFVWETIEPKEEKASFVKDDQLEKYAKQDDGNHGGVHGPHVGHMDPSLNIFFMEKDLKVGKIMPIYFPNRDPSSQHFLPREAADSIPFSSSKLPYLLQIFSFSEGSPQAKAMEDTLRQCELEPMRGNIRWCATSFESMLDFTRGIFGMETQFKVLRTTHLRKSTYQTPLLQNYTILEIPMEISAPKMVACHTVPYPYAVFTCHHPESMSKVFKVSLGGEYGEKVEAVAVCHMDTSLWDPNHVSFRMLGIKKGTAPVCHFFAEDELVWVPSPTSTSI